MPTVLWVPFMLSSLDKKRRIKLSACITCPFLSGLYVNLVTGQGFIPTNSCVPFRQMVQAALRDAQLPEQSHTFSWGGERGRHT
jgi:hypothetical protein